MYHIICFSSFYSIFNKQIFIFFYRAAQRMSNNNVVTKSRVPEMPSSERGGFCGALQRAPPPMPAGLARRLANKDNFGLGKVNNYIYILPSYKQKKNQ